MDEAVIATFNEVNFIEGETFLTQQNWQEYFGPVVKNGVYIGLEPRNYLNGITYTNGRTFITDGTVFANGICAKITTANGYTDIGTCPTVGTHDRLICVRVYFDSQTAQLIQKTNVMDIPEGGTGYKYYSVYAMTHFAHDESYKMERNNSYWDIPIFYQGTQDLEWSSLGLDLRRIINKDREIDPVDTCFKGYYPKKYKISGNNIYHIDAELGSNTYLFAFDMIDRPNEAIIVLNRDVATHSASVATRLSFSGYGATNNFLASSNSGFVDFAPSSNHIVVTGSNNATYYDVTNLGLTFIKVTYAGTKGEMSGNYSVQQFYPFDYYVEKWED